VLEMCPLTAAEVSKDVTLPAVWDANGSLLVLADALSILAE